MTKPLRGIPASAGRRWGPAVMVGGPAVPTVASADLAPALRRVRRDLERERKVAAGPARDILFAHLQLLSDPLLADRALALAAQGRDGIAAWQQATAEAARVLESLGEELFRSRVADLRDVSGRVLAALAAPVRSRLAAGSVVLAPELLPSLVLWGARQGAVAFAGLTGSPSSHACIILRSLGIPAVVGVPGVLALEGQEVLVDGDRGLVVSSPSPAAKRRAQAPRPPGDARPAVTREGQVIPVACNVADTQEVELAAAMGADGIGVYRTELLFAGRQSAPSAHLQERRYREAVALMAGRPVIIRALDAGSDKPLAYLHPGPEANPALGWRGLRALLDRPRLFAAQVRAVLGTAEAGPVSLLLPMVTSLAELRRARELIEGVRGERPLPLGVMIEVPAAASQAEALAGECDFLSIGTNDLLQYFFAADRTNSRLAGRYCALEPAFLRLLGSVAEAGRRRGVPVHLCGELASDPKLVPLLLGLGITELSVRPPTVPAVKAAVRATGPESRELAREACSCVTAEEAAGLLTEHSTP